MKIKLAANILLLSASFLLSVESTGQLDIKKFVLFSGSNSTGTTLIGSSININGGSVGGSKLVQTTGNVAINANIYSGDKIILSNSNVINGRIAAAANYPNSPISTGTILSVGSSASITGNIDVYGNISIGGGSVTGIVKQPAPPPTYTYSGPTPSGGFAYGQPNLPILPNLPIPFSIASIYPTAVTTTLTGSPPDNLIPGNYGNIVYSGNKTLTLLRPGVYVFNSIKMTGNSNKLIFDFDNRAGNFEIYVRNNADFGKLNASIKTGSGGDATRINIEVQGDGTSNTSISGASFIIANGSSGGGSKWIGSVYTPNAGINIGSGTGSSTLTGTFAGKSVTIQSGVTVIYSPFNFCEPPEVQATVFADPLDFEVDTIPLDFTGHTNLIAQATAGAKFSWLATKGGIIDGDTTQPNITVSAAGTYIVSAFFTDTSCSAKDTVVVTAKVRNIIGAELLSIYQNYDPDNPNEELDSFFVTENGYVMIDIICKVDTGIVSAELRNNTTLYGLINIIPNGLSKHTLTGDYPIAHLLNLNFRSDIINFCRTYYKPSLNGGIVTTQGDSSVRTYLVRKGYDLDGSGVKIGVISDSYKTIIAPVTTYDDDCNNIHQTGLKVNTEAVDLLNQDVNVPPQNIIDFPIRLSDEGRAMMQIIHDIAPGAEKFFRTGFFTAGDFAERIEELAGLGCKILVDDVSYLTEPMFKDGVIAKSINKVKNDYGVVYFSAAGNFGNKSYEKDFSPIDATNIGFPGKNAHDFGGGNRFQEVKLKPGSHMFVMQWTDDVFSTGEPDGTHYDVDIFLSKSNDGTGLIGFNRDNEFGDPIEFIPITIPADGPCDVTEKTYYILIINNTSGGDPDRIKYVDFRGGLRIPNNDGVNSTIVGQANAEGAIAVGASRFNHIPKHPQLPQSLLNITKPQIESYSSVGGTFTTDINGIAKQRLKPDLVGPDGVNTTVLMGQNYLPNPLDSFSNFFGTSAAAPHLAAATALLIQGRAKYLAKTDHPVDSLKLLLQTTAVDMRPPEMGTNDYDFFTKTGSYDFVSGAGLADLDSAMRTFASPRPFEIKLVKPTNIIPCQDPFELVIVGENFSLNSIIYLDTNRVAPIEPDSSIKLPYTYLSKTRDTLKVIISSCVGNPFVWVFTDSRTGLAVPDGGLSNGIRLFDKEIIVKTNNVTKLYGQPNPTPTTTITINGKTLAEEGLTLEQVGLDASKLNEIATVAGTYSPAGTYAITVYRTFSNTNEDDLDLTNQYRYTFESGLLTIDPLPITVIPKDKIGNNAIVSGYPVGNIQYTYKYTNGLATITDQVLINKLDSSYKVYKPDNAIAVVNNYPGSTGLTDADLQNISGMVTFEALKNSRKYQVVNGKLTPLPANSTLFNIHYLVDVAAQSLLNFKNDPATATLVPSYPGIHSRAIVGARELAAGEVNITGGNTLGQLVNGLLVKTVNTSAGALAPIYTNNLITMLNGEQITISNNGDTSVIPNTSLVQLANGLLVKTVNNELVPLENNTLVKLINNTIIYQTSNALLVKTVNNTNEPVLNGLLVKTVNGLLVKTVNGVDEPVADNTVILMTNGLLVKTVNNTLLQLTNGTTISLAFPGVQVVNGRLVQTVNNVTIPISNGVFVIDQITNNVVQQVNSFTSTAGNNEDAAVIIDSDDIDVQNGFLGAMFSTDMITGLTIGTHTLIPGALFNPNFKISYAVGHAEVVEDNSCLQTHSPFKNFGNTTQQPTSLWLNLTTKVSGQLVNHGDYLLFKNASVTFNNIASNPTVTDHPVPDGMIVGDSTVTAPITHYDFANQRWITKVPVMPSPFASTSDIFVTGAIINSSNGFVKQNGNTNSVVKGAFFSNKTFSDQWAYGIAAYQPQFNYTTIGGEGQVVSINGSYRAGTPLVGGMPLQTLVQGGSGGGGNSYTGSTSSFQAFTACIDLNPLPPSAPNINSSITMEAVQSPTVPFGPEVLINPNPAKGQITVSFVPAKTGNSKIEIFTINGRKVLEMDYGITESENRYIKQVDVNKLITGIYLVRVWNAGTVTNKKIVIAR